MCLEDMASTENDELDCRFRQEDKSSQSSQNNIVSAITLATNLSVIIIVDQ